MKKVTLLLLLVIVASSLLMAAAPLKLVRIWTINKSGHTIYMKLEGQSEGNFYYLTIPWGDKTMPDESSYTVITDVYDRTTWYGPGDYDCEGLKSTGELWAVKQMKLTFTPCGQINWISGWWVDPVTGVVYWVDRAKINYGEPSWGEKVSYFKYLAGTVYVNVNGWGCTWGISSKSYKSPKSNCFFLYKY